MRIISRSALRDFWSRPGFADAEQPLKSWFSIARRADWNSPQAAKRQFGQASVVGNNRVVFNIGGNKYRLVVSFNYPYRIAYIRFVGTHEQYDRSDAENI